MEKRVFKSNFPKGAVCAALAALLCAALLTCSNSAGGSDAPSSQQSVSSSSRKPGYVTLTGTVSVSGAVPQILADTPDASDNAENGLSRSAYPGIDASGADATMEYFATATCGSDVVNGTFGSGREAKRFGIELAASKTWSVVVGVRSKTADAEGNKKIYLQSKPWSVTPDPADPTISRNFVPVPIVTNAGKGTIELAVNYIHSVFDTSARFVSGPSGYDSLPIISSTEGNDQIYKVLNVPSGTYELCIDIMEIQGANKFLVYSSIQTVSVADGMTTNAWVSDGSGIIDSNGTFKFNDSNATALKQSYLSSNIYVGKYSDESNSQIADASDTNSGNWMAPLASINQAVNRINSAGKSNIDYVVHLNGKIQSTDLNNTTRITASTVTATHAKSITIVGTTGPSKDILEATKQGTPALMVTTSVPIIIKNIKLDGYSGAGSSAALDASGGAKVTIESGVEIADADLGVRVADTGSDGTTVTMKGGTISGNVTAVDLQGGDFILQGGSIPYDTSISSTKKNDVKLASGKVIKVQGDLTAVTGDKIGVTPSERKRGVKVVDTSAATANAATVEGKFLIADPTITSTNPLGDEWKVVAVATSTEHALKTNAPIYVGKKPDGTTDGSNDNAGTKSAPFATIARACQDMDDASVDYIININGTASGQQTVPNTLSKTSGIYRAKSVLIKGVTPIPTSGEQKDIPQDAIDGGGSGGTALTVASAVPITIQNLKITGGAGSQNGGGIYMNPNADVTILGGALITANKAKNHGGGIYCANGSLTIKGGKISANEITGTSGSLGGIGLYAAGSSVIEMTGGEISGNKDTTHVDVVGGGVKLEGSASFKMSGGEVKDNQVVRAGGNFYVTGGDSGPSVTLSGSAKITGGVADSSSFSSQDAIGGAVWLEGAGSSLEMSGGEISGNSAKSSSGKNACAGIYVNVATFTLTGGKISDNNVLGGNIQGGAVRLYGNFNISGSAYIPYGGEIGKNDVYLCDGKTVTIAAALTPPSGVTAVATITPYSYTRRRDILSSDSENKTNLLNAIGKFKLSQDDSGWDRVSNISVASETAKKVWITSPIYVASSEASDSTRKVCSAAPSSGNNGTKTSPYATIAAALADSELSKVDNTITIDGTIDAQTVTSSVSLPTGVTEVTLQGYKASATAASLAQINGGGTASALWLQKDGLTTIIKDLTVTNGNPEYYGGGIRIGNGTVKLTDGALITGNSAQEKGGGVYVDGGGKLFVYGSALIGDSTTSTTTATSSDKANSAPYGGGIYSNGGAVYLGYSAWTSETDNTPAAITAGYGVRRNYATYNGGGIYTSSSSGNPNVYMQSGNVSYNASGSMGGGMLIGYNAKIQGGTISNNKSKNGGAIYDSANIGAVYISESADISGNTATEKGGAVYVSTVGTLYVKGGTITGNEASVSGGAIYNENILQITDGTITGNTAATAGGAVYNAGTLTMSAGTIGSSTSALQNKVTGTSGLGGAIYQNGTFNISGSAKILPGSLRTNDVYLVANGTTAVKQITINGTYNGSGNSDTNKMSVTPAVWKRGMAILDGSKLGVTNSGYFSITDSDWKVLSSTANYGKIDADIWVAGSGYASASGVGSGSDSNPGTKSKPYASIKVAAEACWSTSEDFVINISGMITGATQEIPAANSTAGTTLASKITLKGSSNTTDGINRNLAGSSAVAGGSALIINYKGYVDMTNLKIMGGNTTGNGGGIQINGPSTYSNTTCPRVNLKDGVLVQQNKAVNGGGIYLVKSILCLSGSATIGNSGASDRSAADTAISNNINIATTAGGGIYTSGGQVHFGGAWINGTINKTDTYKLTGGVYANVCTLASGTADEKNQASGGIYCGSSTVYFYSGNINLNYGINTGGVYSTQSGFYMAGGTIHKNAGTGFYNDTNTMFYMYGDACIGERGATGIAKSDDCSNNKGGLINKGFAYLGYSATSTKEKLSGGIYRNYLITSVKNSGGAGIANTGSLYFDSGTIAYNYFYTSQSEGTGGGGIYSNNFVNMSGSSSTQYACITNNQSKEAGGGICLDGTGSKLLMSGYALIGKVSSSVPSVTSGSVTIAKVPGINIASRGGGIAAFNGATICLGYSSFSSPTSNTTASLDNGGVYFNYAEYNGGGIYCQGGDGKTINVYIASGKINANKAAYSSSTTYGLGGGIWGNKFCEIYMGGGQISKNSASTYGGGVYIAGALFMYGSALIGDTNTSTTTTTESNYSNCAKAGGGVYVTSTSGTLALGYDGRTGTDYSEKNLTGGIKHNFATGETTSSTDLTTTTGSSPTPVGIGGGVYMTGYYFYMKSGTIGYNKAYDGAGLAITHSVEYPSVYGGSITYNSARRNGGGVAVHANSYVLIKGSVTYNTAASNGGGFYLTQGNSDEYGTGLHLEGGDGKISNNTATNGNGGGVCSAGGSLFITGGPEMAGNYAGGNGGAVYGCRVRLDGVASIPATSGYVGKTKYNDIYSGDITAIELGSGNLPAGAYFSDMYITLPSGLTASDIMNYKVVLYSWTGTDPGIASNTKFKLTQSSPYYSSKKIDDHGYLVNK